jgi:drug/metabolite transporter (DMT)-like permease
MSWLSLTLVCAFSLAASDAATKKLMSDYSARELVVVRFVATGILLLPLLIVNWTPIPAPFWGWVAALLPFELVAMWLYMKAIRQAPLSQTLPYLAFTPVITIFTGYLLLGERVSARGAGGILLITAGAYLLNIRQLRNGSRFALLQPIRAMMVNAGPRWMLLVAALYSLTSVMGKGAMQYVPPEFFGPFYFALLGLAVAVPYLLGRRGSAGVLGRRPGALLLVGALMALMVYTHFQAIQQVEAAYMISVKRTSVLFGILMGAWLFDERDLPLNLLAGSMMVIGVAMIAL